MPKTLFVMPNPYGQLDHLGRLAGGCLEAEGPRPGNVMPARRFVGATFGMVPGSLNKSDEEGRGVGGPLGVKADYEFAFTASAPVAVSVTSATESFYISRGRSGCVFLCQGAEDVPLEALAKARMKAIADHKAAYGHEPSTAGWEKQFALDAVVADVCKLIQEREAAEAKKAPAPPKAAPKADEDPLKAAKAALEKLRAPALKPAVKES